MNAPGHTFAIVGATGAVGAELLSALDDAPIPVRALRLFSSERSKGESLVFRNRPLRAEALSEGAFEGVDYALFAAPRGVVEGHVEAALAAGATVIDLSPVSRASAPLIVPEINGASLTGQERRVASPSGPTIPLLMALEPLRARFGIERITASTYQSASGAGRRAMDELRDQVVDLLNFKPVSHEIFPQRLAFDVLPAIDEVGADGYTLEEDRLIEEARRVWGRPELPISVTCARIPVFIGDALSIHVELERAATRAQARDALEGVEGLTLSEEGESFTAADVAGQDEVYISRLREDRARPCGLALWASVDNLRKGAAVNAVQIVALMIKKRGG